MTISISPELIDNIILTVIPKTGELNNALISDFRDINLSASSFNINAANFPSLSTKRKHFYPDLHKYTYQYLL